MNPPKARRTGTPHVRFVAVRRALGISGFGLGCTVEDMQIGAADRGRRDFDDGILGVLNGGMRLS